jgi:hypothetical protein
MPRLFVWLILFGLLPTAGSAAAGDILTPAPTSWATVVLAGISAIGGIVTFLKARQVHAGLEETKALVLKIELSVNSRMDKLLKVTAELAERKGAADEKSRQDIISIEVAKQLSPEALAVDTNVTVHKIDDAIPAPQQSEPSATVPAKQKKDS